ncbi:hypothetical protein AB5J49_08090 [Streptomyces sp. R28]|uniref:Uncharacterized protein n=1 Tax=Streptomyces sp. R28 TaxID=3238628 RepID=A0AB39PTB3_9ACTN
MSDRINQLSARAQWFLQNFDEVDLADICASHEASNKAREEALDRIRQVIDERRTEVAEREADGMLPFGTPGASWCDAVTVTCNRIDDALKIPPEPVGIPCPASHDDGPSVAECAGVDRNWDVEKAGE